MPEGPEIRRAADEIAAVLEGHVVEEVFFGQRHLKPFEQALRGHQIIRVANHGKAMLNHFEHGMSIYSHNQLYGVWRVAARGEQPETNRTLRLALHTRTHSALLYSASEIDVWNTGELVEHPFLSRLGPDILDEDLIWQEVAKRLRDTSHANRRLSALYLDQSFLAGLGNYLRSEILFDAGVHYDRRPADLSRRQIGNLSRSTLAISRRSYETAGITNPPRLASRLQAKGLPFGQYRFAVFDRDGQPCYRCGDEITRSAAHSRRIYWCRTCQS